MLADKFNRYKLLLVTSVTLSLVFHTMLLFVDARISPDNSLLRNVTEIPSELHCGRTGVMVRLGNESCSIEQPGKWLAYWTPAECQSFDCNQEHDMRMHLCSSSGNCTQISTKSASVLNVELVLEDVMDGKDNNTCTAKVVALHTDQESLPTTLLCNCLIQCPLTLAISPEPFDEELFNATSVLKESERLKHNQGFWIYFMLRLLASASLATSFSM